VKRLYAPLFTARPWRESLHLLLDLPVGVLFFTAVVALLSTGTGLVVVWIGVPLLAATIWGGRILGSIDRTRAALLLHHHASAPPAVNWPSGLWSRIRTAFTDRAGWKGLIYGVVMLPWGIVAFTFTVILWALAISLPLSWTGALLDWSNDDPQIIQDNRWLVTLAATVLGLAVLAVAPRIVHLLTDIDRALVTGLLARDERTVLHERVEQLSSSRDASVEGAAQELRRIERNLHDGAQQRLVGLAMDLGLARQRLEGGAPTHDALELVSRAHDEAKGAIVELRELVRGIHPSVLTDRGLDAALSALCARSPIPVDLDVVLPARPPSAVEAAAYFVVAEALTNAAKHSNARQIDVRIRGREHSLLAEITDDGRGGATLRPGGGLQGLQDRVAAIDGSLRLASPTGGPTMIRAELPCAW
jgi:signal transduction histidine kinase